MSLFQGRDAEQLPLLTQFAQLDIDSNHPQGGNDLLEFIRRRGGAGTNQGQAYLVIGRGDVLELAALHAAALRIMRALEKSGTVISDDLERIERDSHRGDVTLSYVAGNILVSDAAGPHRVAASPIPVSHIGLDRVRPAESLIGDVARALKNALGTGEPQFRSCPVCLLPFAINRRDQIYCSRRDGIRAGARQQTQRKRILKKDLRPLSA